MPEIKNNEAPVTPSYAGSDSVLASTSHESAAVTNFELTDAQISASKTEDNLDSFVALTEREEGEIQTGNTPYWFPNSDSVNSTLSLDAHRVFRNSKDRKKVLRDVNLQVDVLEPDPLAFAYVGACISRYMSSPTFGSLGSHSLMDAKRMQAFLTKLLDHRSRGFQRRLSREINRLTSTPSQVVFDGERPGASSYVLMSPFTQLLGVDVDAAKATGEEATSIAPPLATSIIVQVIPQLYMYCMSSEVVRSLDDDRHIAVGKYDVEKLRSFLKIVVQCFSFEEFVTAAKGFFAANASNTQMSNLAASVLDGLLVLYANVAQYVPLQLAQWLGAATHEASYARSIFSYMQAAISELLLSSGVIVPFEGVTAFYVLEWETDVAPYLKGGLFDRVAATKSCDYSIPTDLADLAKSASIAYTSATQRYSLDLTRFTTGDDFVAIVCRALRASYANSLAKGKTLSDLLKSSPDIDISYDYRGRLVERASQRVAQQYYDELTLRTILHGLTAVLKDSDSAIDALVDASEELGSEVGDLLIRLATTPAAQFPSEVENSWRKIASKYPALSAFFADSTISSSRAYTLMLRAAFEYKVEAGYEFASSVSYLIKRLSPLANNVRVTVIDNSLDYIGLPSYRFSVIDKMPASVVAGSEVADTMRTIGNNDIRSSASALSTAYVKLIGDCFDALYVCEGTVTPEFTDAMQVIARRFCRFVVYDTLCSQKKLAAIRQHPAGKLFSAYVAKWSSNQRAESGKRIDDLMNITGFLVALRSGAQRQLPLLLLAEAVGYLSFVAKADIGHLRERYGLLVDVDDFTIKERIEYMNKLIEAISSECAKYAYFDFASQADHYRKCFEAPSFWNDSDVEQAAYISAVVCEQMLKGYSAKRLIQKQLLSKTSFENSMSADFANAPSIEYIVIDGFAASVSSEVASADTLNIKESAQSYAGSTRADGDFLIDPTQLEDDAVVCGKAIRSSLSTVQPDPFGSRYAVKTVSLARLMVDDNLPSSKGAVVRRSDELDECFYSVASRIVRRKVFEVARFKPQIAGLPGDVIDDDADVILRLVRLFAWRSQCQSLESGLKYAWVQQSMSRKDLDAVLGLVGLSPSDTVRLGRARQLASYIELARGASSLEVANDAIKAVSPLELDWEALNKLTGSLRRDVRLDEFLNLEPSLIRSSGVYSSVLIRYAADDFLDRATDCVVQQSRAHRTAYWFERVSTLVGELHRSINPDDVYLLCYFADFNRRGRLSDEHYKTAGRKLLSQLSECVAEQIQKRVWKMGPPIKPDELHDSSAIVGVRNSSPLDDDMATTLKTTSDAAQSVVRDELYV